MDLFDLASRVKRGVRLLDKKVPEWRQIIRRHANTLDLADGDFCVLGTLEHHSARMRQLHAKRVAGMDDADYHRALDRLGIIGSAYGFTAPGPGGGYDDETENDQFRALTDLWKIEAGLRA